MELSSSMKQQMISLSSTHSGTLKIVECCCSCSGWRERPRRGWQGGRRRCDVCFIHNWKCVPALVCSADSTHYAITQLTAHCIHLTNYFTTCLLCSHQLPSCLFVTACSNVLSFASFLFLQKSFLAKFPPMTVALLTASLLFAHFAHLCYFHFICLSSQPLQRWFRSCLCLSPSGCLFLSSTRTKSRWVFAEHMLSSLMLAANYVGLLCWHD